MDHVLKYNKHVVPLRILNGITSAALFIAIANNPYIYYILLRWLVFGVAIYSLWYIWKNDLRKAGIMNLFSIVIFNPLLPLYLSKETWITIDLVFGVLFLLQTFTISEAEY